jgi:hypothetical protein
VKVFPVVTSTALAVIPSLSTIWLPTWLADGVNETWICAETLWPGATSKLFHTTDDPLATMVPFEAEAETNRTFWVRWLVTVWPKFQVSLELLVTVSVMVQVDCTPTVGVVGQVALCVTVKGAV